MTDPSGNWVDLLHGDDDPRPARLVIAVDDLSGCASFYRDAFGVPHEDADDGCARFSYGAPEDAFELRLLAARHGVSDGASGGASGGPGRANFSFLVDDLDAVHRRALAAGGTQIAGPHDTEGMPRNSAITDPSGNWLGLAQG